MGVVTSADQILTKIELETRILLSNNESLEIVMEASKCKVLAGGRPRSEFLIMAWETIR